MQESIELYMYFASVFCLQHTHTLTCYLPAQTCVCIYMQAMSTNLSVDFKVIYMCSIQLIEHEGEKNYRKTPKGC